MAENVVITKQARMKIVKARAGAITLPKVVGLAFGDGGVNSKGDVISPVDTQTNLNHELFFIFISLPYIEVICLYL